MSRYLNRPRRLTLADTLERPGLLEDAPNPSGLCMCGCGAPTPLATRTQHGLVAGLPTRYIRGHGGGTRRSIAERLTPERYAVEDRRHETPCWIWLGAQDGQGYGTLSFRTHGQSRTVGVHRISYEHHNGPIPEGYHVHHECAQRACLNPAHLRALSNSDHGRVENPIVSHCFRGHEYTPENTYVHAPSGKRKCRTCDREWYHRNRKRATA